MRLLLSVLVLSFSGISFAKMTDVPDWRVYVHYSTCQANIKADRVERLEEIDCGEKPVGYSEWSQCERTLPSAGASYYEEARYCYFETFSK